VSTAPSERTARGGRPRDTAIDDAVLAATLDALGVDGYGGLSLTAVARAAGTSKPALYRRWPTRARLVLAALERRVHAVDPPNTSCTMCDLAECLGLFVTAYEKLPPGVLAPLLAEADGEAGLRDEFMARLFDPPRDAVRRTLTRARDRGDLRRDMDLTLTVDVLASFICYRAMFGHAPTTPGEVESAVETILQGVAADYPALLARAQGEPVAVAPHGLHAPHAPHAAGG
jgi:AcrR family transcriptional regulator